MRSDGDQAAALARHARLPLILAGILGLVCAATLLNPPAGRTELLEWWVALLAAPGVGTAFLGTQGDVWDTPWDMFLALVGALVSLALFTRAHDRAMSRVPWDGPPR